MDDRVSISHIVPPTELTPAREDWLIQGLVEALPTMRMGDLFAQRRDMFTEADLITVAIAESSARPVGVLSSRCGTLDTGERFLHVMAQFVGDHYRLRAVFQASWVAHLARLSAGGGGFPEIIALKTRNPVAFCAIRTMSRIIRALSYPSLTGTQPADVAELATRIAGSIALGHPFDPATGVVTGAGVPADLYTVLPTSADKAVNRYFAEVTGPADRVLCLLVAPPGNAARAMPRFFPTAPRHSTHTFA